MILEQILKSFSPGKVMTALANPGAVAEGLRELSWNLCQKWVVSFVSTYIAISLFSSDKFGSGSVHARCHFCFTNRFLLPIQDFFP